MNSSSLTSISAPAAHAAAVSRSGSRVRRETLVLGGATLATGLLAGLYYAYSCSVMPGLHGTGDVTFVESMQHINRSIQNPVFFLTFLGAPALVVVSLISERRHGDGEVSRWLWAAAGLNALALLVTMGLNVPLNETLQRAGDPHHLAQLGRLAHVRSQFEAPWVVGNVARTLATIGAFGCLLAAGVRRAVLAGRRGDSSASIS